MKKTLLLLAVFLAAATSAWAQTNRNAECKRFVRGIAANPPVLKSFVIPLDFEKGVELDAMGDNSGKFPEGTPWFIQVPRDLRYHFGLSENGTSLDLAYKSTPFENPIVAFGSGAGGTQLFLNRTYRFGVHAGPQVQVGSWNPFALGFWITAYRKSTLEYVDTQYFILPRRDATDPAEKARWDSYVNNGFSWPTPEFPGGSFYGLTTQIEYVEGGIDAPGWGVGQEPIFPTGQATYPGYILSHTATSDEYCFKVESLAYYPIVLGGAQNYLPNAATIVPTAQGDQLTSAQPSTLYAINFDQKPTWRATDVDKPQFQGEPMPPAYLGKTRKELLDSQNSVNQTVSGSPSSYTSLDQSTELRQHPVLDSLVDSLVGNFPTPEQKAIALANFVQNEIALCDPMNYNESGNVAEASINPGGVNRGALATYLEGQGSPIEKAALLVYMLRKAGIPAAYMFPEKNKLKMLDIRMSSILKFQIKGAVDNLGNTEAPYDPEMPSLIPVNYPWVAANINNQWTHFFPWITDTEVVEGYNLYDYMPDGYKNAHQWIDKYLNGDTAILGLGTEAKSPGILFQKFIKAKLAENYPDISIDEIGMRYRDRKNYYSRLEDFPKPFEVTGTPETVAALSSKADIFDTIKIKVSSVQAPSKSLETQEIPIAEFHNRKLLLRQSKIDASTHQFSLTLSPFRPGASGTASFGSGFDSLPLKQVALGNGNLVGTDKNLNIEISVKRNKRYFNNFTAPTDRWNSFLGYSSGSSYATTLSINKGDLAAICLSVGKVSARMMEEHAKEFWQMEAAVQANPTTTQDPDIYQGTAAYLMGMSYYNKLDTFTETNARLHKRLLIGNLAMGLAVLKAEYVGGVLPNGDIRYVQPVVDMFYQDIGMVGNESVHADSGIENIPAKKDFEAMNITAGSAFEHEVIDTYFTMGDSISTVELLRIAKNDPVKYPNGFYELTVNNYMSYDAAMTASDPGLWAQVKGYFATPDFGKYVKAYITSKPVVGASGAYTGMGALIFGQNQWGALISKNLSGGAGRNFSNLNSFSYSNVPNISLDYNFSSIQPAYTLYTAPPPTPATPVFTPTATTASWNYSTTFSSISTGASYFPSVDTNSWAASASSLGYSLSGSGSSNIANLLSLSYNTGSAGVPDFYGSAKSVVSAVSNFVLDPVSVVTGEFYIDTVDLRLEGPMPLEIRRNYSSKNLAHNNFGYGWRWSYFPYLVVGKDADIIQAADADGSVIAFRKQSDTEWKPVAADNPALANLQGDQFGSTANLFNSRIVKSTTGATYYTLTGPDGSVRRFKVRSFPTGGTNGASRERPYLEQWTDNSGNYYTFEFGASSTDPGYGEVTRVVSSNGNFIAFDYDIYGQILRAYAGDGRRVEYRYDAYGDLVEVVRPDASTYQYEYDHVSDTQAGQTKFVSSHKIVHETKPGGRILENVYDSESRVVAQKATVGPDLVPVQNATFAYSQTVNDADKTTTGYTIVSDAYGHPTRYEYTNSQITLVRDPLNQEIRQEWFQPGDVSAGAYPRSMKSRTDKRGLTTTYKYSAQGNVVEKKVAGNITGTGSNDSATTSALYNTLNLPTTITDVMGNQSLFTYGDANYPYLPTAVERKVGGTVVNRTVNQYSQAGTGNTISRGLLTSTTVAAGTSDAAVTTMEYNPNGFPSKVTKSTGTGDPDVVTRFTYNLRGEVVEQKDALNRMVGYAYDAMGRRTWEEYRNEGGALVGWNYSYYNLNGELEWSDGPRYSPEDYVWRKFDGAGRPKEEIRWRSQASDSGVEAGSGDGLYSTTFFEHDLFGNQTQIRHANGSTTSMTYDSVGRMLTRSVSGGSATASESFSYEPGDQVASHTNPLGGVTTKTYTSAGQILSQSNPDGTVLGWQYGLDGRAVREPASGSSYWEIAYDDASRTVTRTLKSGGSTLGSEEKVFDRRGNPIRTTDLAGNVFTSTFDALNRVKTSTGPDASGAQQSSTSVYDSSGKVVETTNALGEKSVVTTDILGRMVSKEIIKASDSVLRTSVAYAPDHNSSTVTIGSGGGAITSTTFTDTFNNPVLVQRGNEETERSVYDSSGNLLASYDALGRATTFTYDGLNRLIKQTIPGGAVTTFVPDAAGNILERKMPGNLTQVSTYDSAGRIRSTSLHGSSTTRAFGYSYHSSGAAAGLLQTTTDPRGITFTHEYDAFSRPSSVTATGSSAAQNQTRSWSYDPRGIPLTISQTGGDQPDSLITRVPDAYGHATSESLTLGGSPVSTITQAWDAAGRRTSLDTGMGYQATFQHNAAGQMTSVSEAGISSTFAYTGAGLLNSRTNPLRTQSVTGRDANGRILNQVTSVAAGTLLAEAMTWRADGTLATYAADRNGGWNENRAYGYDSRGHVLSESYAPRPGATATLNYTFDAEKRDVRTGARVDAGGAANWFVNATTVDGLARSAQFLDNTGRRTVPATGVALGAASVAISVDGKPAGNATHPGWQDATGTWTADLRLFPGLHSLTARATHPSGWTTPPTVSEFAVNGVPETFTQTFDAAGNVTTRTWSGGKIQTFTWDAFGQLVRVVQTGVEPSTWTASYDGLGRRLETSFAPTSTPPATPTIVRSIYDPQAEFLEIGVAVGGVQQWKVFGPDLHGGSLNGTGGLEFVITPAGNLGAINDTFGNVVASVGATATWSPVKVGGYGPLPGTDAQTLENGASVLDVSAWRTRRMDPTGFMNLGARHYDPERGIFLSCDPLGHAASVSLYDYCSGDAVNAFDADGRLSTGIGKGAVIGDYYQPTNFAQGVGQFIGQTAISFVPWVGQAADARDFSAAVGSVKSEGLNWRTGTSLAVGVVAFIPGIGDVAKGIAKPLISSAPVSPTVRAVSNAAKTPLVVPQAGEDLFVGLYGQTRRANIQSGLNTTHTPHHVVQNAVSETSHSLGVTINMRKDLHELTRTFGTNADRGSNMLNLAADVSDLRNIFRGAGYDRSLVNQQMQRMIELNRQVGNVP